MSILIKGVEMPETCYDCPFAAALFRPTHKSGRKPCEYACILTQCALTSTKRNRNCPLAELPPHGRLIDADALDESLGIEDSDIYVHWTLESAPTIIEAEEEDNG